MEFTYTVTGADGLHYGPIPLDRIKAWVAEGRLNAETQILRNDTESWQPAANYPELGLDQSAPAMTPPPLGSATVAATPAIARPTMATRPIPTTIAAPSPNPASVKRLKSGADWFYWIAALSLVNSVLAFTGSGFGFAIGLGVSQVIDAVAHEMGPTGVIGGLVCNIFLAGLFVVFGIFARKRHTWSFIVGMVLYGLDVIWPLKAQEWLSVGIHAFAIFCIFVGFQACRQLNADAHGETPH